MNQLSSEQESQLQELGTYLRQKRIEQSISLKQVASRTLIRSELLQAIEDGKTEQLPEPIYLQNLIRHYANAIHADGEKLASSFSQKPAPIISEILSRKTSPSNRRFRIILVLFLLASAACGLFYLVTRSPTLEEPQRVETLPSPPTF